MKRILAALIAVLFIFGASVAESRDDVTTLYVTASLLNGRAAPSKKATVEARFDHGDSLSAFDWSDNHHWIEVIGGETGTVWVWWEYVTERLDEFVIWNDYGSKVKIRSGPFGRVIGYLKTDGELVIDKVILGWGHSSKGWINLKYVTEED